MENKSISLNDMAKLLKSKKMPKNSLVGWNNEGNLDIFEENKTYTKYPKKIGVLDIQKKEIILDGK